MRYSALLTVSQGVSYRTTQVDRFSILAGRSAPCTHASLSPRTSLFLAHVRASVLRLNKNIPPNYPLALDTRRVKSGLQNQHFIGSQSNGEHIFVLAELVSNAIRVDIEFPC